LLTDYSEGFADTIAFLGRSASKPSGNNAHVFKDVDLEAEARIWP
jgi:hypothetical protein